jgi:hypothetical protein
VQAVVDEVWRGYKEGWMTPLSGERERDKTRRSSHGSSGTAGGGGDSGGDEAGQRGQL